MLRGNAEQFQQLIGLSGMRNPIHGQAADVATELEELIREQPVVDDPTRLLDGNLRPAEAVVA